jgi:hypothetical protein
MAFATLNALPVSQLRLCVPRIGCWHADVLVDSDEDVMGQVSLVLGDIEFKGTIRRGGVANGALSARVVGGAAGLNVEAGSQGYTDVPVQVPLLDALKIAGETLSPSSSPQVLSYQLRHYARFRGPVSESIQALMFATPLTDLAWRVRRDGMMWVGQERWANAEGEAELLKDAKQLGRRLLYLEAPVLEPGTVFQGHRLSYCQYTLENGAFRTEVWHE